MVREFVQVGDAQEDFNAFLSEFQRETDRAAAVLAVAYLDAQLEDLLKATLIGTRAELARLVGPSGPLDTFSSRLRICAAMGLISGELASDLDRVRGIRNDFAHRLHGLSFTAQTVADRCEHFVLVRLFAESGRVPPRWLDSARQRFNLAVTLLAFQLRKLLDAPARFTLRHPLTAPLDEIHRDDSPET